MPKNRGSREIKRNEKRYKTEGSEVTQKKYETLVLTVTKMSILVFWVVTLCGLIRRYECFGGT
jgi:hypothetical protein